MIQAYNYLIESYQPNKDIKYRACKSGELKRVYDSIVSISKRSPLYKINLSKENQDYAIGIKELSIVLRSKIGEMTDPAFSGFKSKVAAVSDERILSAKLISQDTDSLPETITIKVNSLASPQVNKGRELLNTSRGLEWGTYEFAADIKDHTYELIYNQPERAENSLTLQKMADFLNRSLSQITVSVEKGDKNDYSKLVITSQFTGNAGGKSFSFTDDESGFVDFFGMNRIENAPANSNFELNGISKQTMTNSFTIENTLQIDLHQAGDNPVMLRIVPDKNRILDGVDSVIDTFNGLIRIANSRTEATKEHFGASKLISEMKNLETTYQDELEACGLKASEQGMLSIDDALAAQAAEDGGMESLFTRENGFIARVLDKAEAITINPMDYLDKVIVTYPDSSRTAYANPYITSMYSGLFFNSYC